tara:strand:+ start:939 stop:1133 length:195 start_codon:yes stop_codon:yes gene_type:complete
MLDEDWVETLEIKAITDTGDTYIIAHEEEGSEGLYTELLKTSVTPELQAKIDAWVADGGVITIV